MNSKSAIDRLVESPMSYFRCSDAIDGTLFIKSTGTTFAPYSNTDHEVLPIKIDYPELMDDIWNFCDTALADEGINRKVIANTIEIEDASDDFSTYHGRRNFYCTSSYLRKNFRRLYDAIKAALDEAVPRVECMGLTYSQPINQNDARRLLKTHQGYVVSSEEVAGMQPSGVLSMIRTYDIDRRSIVAFPYKGRDQGDILLIFTNSPEEAEALARAQARKNVKI